MVNFQNAELQELLDSFNTLTGLHASLFDTHNNEILFSNGTPLSPQKWSGLCSYFRSNPAFDDACRRSDIEAMRKCRTCRTAYQYRCHAGLVENVLPLYYDDAVVGFICFGQVADSSEAQKLSVLESAEKYGFDADLCLDYYRSLPCCSPEKLEAAGRILEACASYIYYKDLLRVRSLDLPQQIEKYILENLSLDLSTEFLCKNFSVSRTELYRLFHESFNSGVADFVRNKRVSAAELLLRTTDRRISEIASSVGFYDYNYFSKIFFRHFGLSPRNYRKKFPSEKSI